MFSVSQSNSLKEKTALIYQETSSKIGIVCISENHEAENLKGHCLSVLLNNYHFPDNQIIEVYVPCALKLPSACEILLNSNSSIKVIIAVVGRLKDIDYPMESFESNINHSLQYLTSRYNKPIICGSIHSATPIHKLSIVYAESAINMLILPAKIQLNNKIEESLCLIRQTIQNLGGIDNMGISFNGGKDCLAVLELLKIALGSENLHKLKVFYFCGDQEEEWPEIIEFVKLVELKYSLSIKHEIYEKNIKLALESFVQKEKCLGLFMGQRHTDMKKPITAIAKTDKDWVQIDRINPILNWTYYEVWAFLLMRNVPYCKLYDQGYSSLGTKSTTAPNSQLIRSDGSYKSPWMLPLAQLERCSRTNYEKQKI